MARAPRIDAATRRAQAEASDPKGSAWVSANAGSGKTFVLARRVVRLLLAGADPARILCLTFTKAAAAQMASRVFEQLARWATLADAALARELGDIEGRPIDDDDLVRARRLFARALETPGGLKIQTIHAFCERLLHQFPFEANVAGHFEVLDERDAAALADTARRTILARANDDPAGRLGQALGVVLAAASDMMNDLAVAEFVRNRDRVRAWIVAAGSLGEALAELRERLGLRPGDTVAGLHADVSTGSRLAPADVSRLLSMLERGKGNDQKAAERLAPWREATSEAERGAALLEFWTKSDRELRAARTIVTKSVKDFWPGLDQTLDAESGRIAPLLDRITAAECYESSAAMLTIADAAIQEYDRLKKVHGVLDFDDLIVSTVGLLSRADASRWVHYKLDRGLDHILVDEAQDTSPRQWQVIGALVEDFFAGAGASESIRTLFAVGDEKQSIFSFQGAVPRWFAEMRRRLGGQAKAAGYAWTDPSLHLSFRSAQVVLDAVDTVFADEAVRRGLSAEGAAPTHTAARYREPGRVVLWPMIERSMKDPPPEWTAPLDELGDQSPEVRLAERIARTIAGWIRDKETLDASRELIRPGGIVILARTRGAQTDAIIRALKTNSIAIAGADRIRLAEHIAVMDLMALGRVMLLPEDDLSLASLLKSPLVGLGEDELFALAHGRGSIPLWTSLGIAAAKDGVYRQARATLDDWRRLADYLDPHAFFARVLGPDHGRRRFLARLGAEAEDVLDEFLAQALAFEQANTPSLQGFIAWLEASETEIKRDAETARNEVRVMTVHGAKGLEADIVFLIDTGAMPAHHSHAPRVVSLDDDRDGTPHPLVWMRKKKAMPAIVQARVDSLREQAEEEYRRLLYVAMTRAKDRLYICGTEKQVGKDEAPKRWHALVSRALEPECTRHEAADGAVTLEWRAEPRPAKGPQPEQGTMDFWPQFPAWLEEPVRPPPAEARRLSPSTALAGGGVARRPPPRFDAGTVAALERGRVIHRLLESLPEAPAERRAELGARYLAAAAKGLAPDERAALLDEVLRILADPVFAPVFAEGSRAEVEIAGTLSGAILSGRIDRLAVTRERILVVDYKTNRPAPESLAETPADYVAQLALYRDVLSRLYPGRSVTAAILWTDRPALVEVPGEALDSALLSVSAPPSPS